MRASFFRKRRDLRFPVQILVDGGPSRSALLRRLDREMPLLLAQKAHSKIDVSEEVLSDALSQMRDDLTVRDVRQKRGVLSAFVERIEAEKDRARLWYSFPLLAQRGLHIMPPGEFDMKVPLF